MAEDHYEIHGGLGSPYSMKMRAILRYRRLRHVWHQVEVGTGAEIFSQVKVPVIPVLRFPDGSYHNDSTPLIYALEQLHGERSIVPDDPALAFLAFLLEDMADEWGTKIMFHYRWYRDVDQKQLSEWLAFDRFRGGGPEQLQKVARAFRERQVGRMALVGCTDANRPLIEESARRILALFEAHVQQDWFFFGSRPSLAEFGWFGQLSQLAVDPTPAALLRDTAPFTLRWVENMHDVSGVEGRWRDRSAPLPEVVSGLLALAGEIYFPFLLANAAALDAGEPTFRFEALQMPYEQGTFKYQAKCLLKLREAFGALDGGTRSYLEPLLAEHGCLTPLVSLS